MKNKTEEGNEPVISFTTFSFGCRVNEAERQALESRLIEAGFTPDRQKPQICLINTCAVTSKAEREAKQLIYRLRRDFPQAKIVVTGCAATYWKKNSLNQKLPVDMVVDNVNKEYLVKSLLPKSFRKPNFNFVGYKSKYGDSNRVLIKIQDGCQRFCTYCIVPYLRGQPRSERISTIITRVNSLSLRGGGTTTKQSGPVYVNEIIFTAINTEAFGYDTGETFVDLLRKIIDKTTIPRISCGSINPWSINDDFLRLYKQHQPLKRFVNFFHIPLQSGSNKILSLMKRGYTAEDFMDKIVALHKINPFALIATDIIVGFLDETDKDFEDTYRFLEKSPIAKFHIFRFSKRDNTAADFMAKQLKEPVSAIKNERAKRLKELGGRKYNQFLIKLVNYNSTALFINKSEGDYQEALLDNQTPAWIKTENNLNGQIKNVRITEPTFNH